MPSVSQEDVFKALSSVMLPTQTSSSMENLVSADMIRALSIHDGLVRFVIELDNAIYQNNGADIKKQAEQAVMNVGGVRQVQIALTATQNPAATAESSAASSAPPPFRVGGHPRPAPPQPQRIAGVAHVLVVGSGKGGVGKSTVSSNLAVALARQGRRVGLLDADMYGPSQHRMMGTTEKPESADGKTLQPVEAHGIRMISLGLMVKPEQAVVWRGPMLMGAMQQFMHQVNWQELDVLVIDLPPGTGDVQLTLCQRAVIDGAIIVSTPQDVALIDARKAIDMFQKLQTPIIGLVENMSIFCCPKCGHETHIFGHGGVEAEAKALGLPFLGALPLTLSVREASDAGVPIAATEHAEAAAYHRLAADLIAKGQA